MEMFSYNPLLLFILSVFFFIDGPVAEEVQNATLHERYRRLIPYMTYYATSYSSSSPMSSPNLRAQHYQQTDPYLINTTQPGDYSLQRAVEYPISQLSPVKYVSNQLRPVKYPSNQFKPVEYPSNQLRQVPIEYLSNQLRQPVQYPISQLRPVKYTSNQLRPVGYPDNRQRLVEVQRNVQPVEYKNNLRPVEYKGNLRPVEYKNNLRLVEYKGNLRPVEYKNNLRPVEYKNNLQPVEYLSNPRQPVEYQRDLLRDVQRPVEYPSNLQRPVEYKSETEKPVEYLPLSQIIDILRKAGRLVPASTTVSPDENDYAYYDDEEDTVEDVSSRSKGSTPGKPGIDYPILEKIPETSFDCKTQRYKGFFGDPSTGCQVWHYCDLNGGKASFLCPNGTIFSQVGLTCDWWFNVRCDSTVQLYVLNERLYKYILPVKPSFPEDYSGPIVDRYLTLKFQEKEDKRREKELNNTLTK